MRIVKSVYGGSSRYHAHLEDGVGNLINDLERYTMQVIKGVPGSSAHLRRTLRNSMTGLRNYEFDLYERLISFGRALRILVTSSNSMNKEVLKRIRIPMKSLVQTYFHIAFQTSHKEITETAAGLAKDVADDPNEVSFLPGY